MAAFERVSFYTYVYLGHFTIWVYGRYFRFCFFVVPAPISRGSYRMGRAIVHTHARTPVHSAKNRRRVIRKPADNTAMTHGRRWKRVIGSSPRAWTLLRLSSWRRYGTNSSREHFFKKTRVVVSSLLFHFYRFLFFFFCFAHSCPVRHRQRSAWHIFCATLETAILAGARLTSLQNPTFASMRFQARTLLVVYCM